MEGKDGQAQMDHVLLPGETSESFSKLPKEERHARFRGILCPLHNRVLGNPKHPTELMDKATDLFKNARSENDALEAIVNILLADHMLDTKDLTVYERTSGAT